MSHFASAAGRLDPTGALPLPRPLGSAPFGKFMDPPPVNTLHCTCKILGTPMIACSSQIFSQTMWDAYSFM